MSLMLIPGVFHAMKLYLCLSMPKSSCSMGISEIKEKTLSTAESRLNTNAPTMYFL